MIGIIILGVIVVLVLIFIGLYNRIVELENRIDNAASQIDVQLKKRADLVPNLVETVKGYAAHEKGILETITKLRSELIKAKDLQTKTKVGNQLQEALKSLFAVAENYPTLKANENFLQLQQELSDIEDKIAYARQYFNDTVLAFNNTIEKFPGNIVAKMMNKKEKPYLEVPESEKQVVKVKF
ncbi:MAG: LemA protein [Candidatus Woesearchaeota archaeon]|nr:LemA protein [Candidatus Woesearchaeota archaeon]MDN5327532.1 LemA protein [Candidatus Woesearchaeota archaeon]